MGTRADFYIRDENSEPKMKWLGSKAWDGYPDGIDKTVLNSTSAEEYFTNVTVFLSTHKDSTLPDQGWPWPWRDSRTTDFSYIFENGKVMASCFGRQLFDPLLPESESDEGGEQEGDEKLSDYFPDMEDVKNVAWDERSGIIIFRF